MTERYCSNCRAELPEKADACPECGVYAGDLFDERSLRPRTRLTFVLVLLVVIAAAAAFLYFWPKREQVIEKKAAPQISTRVVGDRPGGARRAPRAAINEAEATRLLRSHLVTTTSVASACVVIMSHGPKQGAYFFSAFNRCERTRMGRWRVDGKSGEASLAK